MYVWLFNTLHAGRRSYLSSKPCENVSAKANQTDNNQMVLKKHHVLFFVNLYNLEPDLKESSRM